MKKDWYIFIGIESILLIVMTIIALYFYEGCNIEPAAEGSYGYPARFVLIDEWTSVNDNECKIYADTESEVLYLFTRNGSLGGLTPLYNTDGSLMTLGGERNEE